jgi:lysophospholipase L1-like esterase
MKKKKTYWSGLEAATLTGVLLLLNSMILCRAAQADTGFATFDRRARRGNGDVPLNVVFFGASLTWGANSTDPPRTSYRAHVEAKLRAKYPRAHFRFFDAAIGGTNSQLGAFRLDRDVLGHHPNLVFLDFSLNDDWKGTDTERLASYEALVRRLILEARCPVEMVFLPGREQAAAPLTELEQLPRYVAHQQIARAYNCGVGDAMRALQSQAAANPALLDLWWDTPDPTHPGDAGYAAYAEAVWNGFETAVREKRVCHAPPAPLYDASVYMTPQRIQLAQLATLPDGWSRGKPNRTSAWFDALMSRWLDSEAVAHSGAAPLHLKFRGAVALLFGESTPRSGRLRVTIDGHATEYNVGGAAGGAHGNVHFDPVLATGLDATKEHTLVLEPLLEAGQELRIESLCVSGAPLVPGKVAVSDFALTPSPSPTKWERGALPPLPLRGRGGQGVREKAGIS